MTVNTYPEMNETIKDLLRRSEEPMNAYILARIEELERIQESAARNPDLAIADHYKTSGLTMDRIDELIAADKAGRVIILPDQDYTWTIRGDIMNSIVIANCRAATKETKT